MNTPSKQDKADPPVHQLPSRAGREIHRRHRRPHRRRYRQTRRRRARSFYFFICHEIFAFSALQKIIPGGPRWFAPSPRTNSSSNPASAARSVAAIFSNDSTSRSCAAAGTALNRRTPAAVIVNSALRPSPLDRFRRTNPLSTSR